jgi:hypothetical protein
VKVSVRVIRNTQGKGVADLRRRVQGGGQVSVGVPRGAREPDGTSIAMIAAAHEFGVPPFLPERSFLRAGIRANIRPLMAFNRRQMRAVARGTVTTGIALAQLGTMAAGAVKRYFTNGNFAPLKEETKRRKGSSKPLIDSGNLRQSITWKVSR